MRAKIIKEKLINRGTGRQYLLKRRSSKQKRAIVLRNFKQPKGQANPNWKGGREVTKAGYVRLWISRTERVLEHRKVMEDHLGRRLFRYEVVHHINGNNADNRLANLELTTFLEDISHHNLERNKKAAGNREAI